LILNFFENIFKRLFGGLYFGRKLFFEHLNSCSFVFKWLIFGNEGYGLLEILELPMRVLKPEIGIEGDVMLLQSGDIFGGTDRG
jgi:hypothetical protein